MKRFPRLPRLEVLIIAGAALAAFVITLAIVASSAGAGARQAAEAQRRELARQQKPALLSAEELALTAEDFILPPAKETGSVPRYAPFRGQLSRWTPEMVSKYWVPPGAIALELLETMNDQAMARLFEKVR